MSVLAACCLSKSIRVPSHSRILPRTHFGLSVHTSFPVQLATRAFFAPFRAMSEPSAAQLTGSYPSFTTVNYYAGSNLSRLSWMRTDSEFLNSTIASPHTRFVLLNKTNPLCHGSAAAGTEQEGGLVTLSWDQVKPHVLDAVRKSGGVQADEKELLVFGPESYGLKNTDTSAQKEFTRATDGVGPWRLALVFLGIDETGLNESSLPGQLASQAESVAAETSDARRPAGVPYFGLSLTYRPPLLHKDEPLPLAALLSEMEKDDRYDFLDLRGSARAATWPMADAALVAQAKSLLDWNERHTFCPGCARQQYSLWAGYKRGCSSSLRLAAENPDFTKAFHRHDDDHSVCPSSLALSNYQYPRTDPVIIMAILSPDGEKVLLGRQKKWPKGFYSCLAGFCEPGESFEEAVRREVLEEAGVKVQQVIYHSSQPWPYPANLMAGFYGIAQDANPDAIRLDLDNELEDARWCSKAEILATIRDAAKNKTSHFTRAELDKLDKEHADEPAGTDSQRDNQLKLDIRLPPETAIARVLITAWANGHAVLPDQAAAAASATSDANVDTSPSSQSRM